MRELRITITVPLSDDTFDSAVEVAEVGKHLAEFTSALADTKAVVKHEVVSARAKSDKPRAKKEHKPAIAEVA